MFTRRDLLRTGAIGLTGFAAYGGPTARVGLHRVPAGGFQPQAAADANGDLHVVYYSGDAHAGNLFYVRSHDGGRSFLKPVAVNGNSGSAMAAGTIRGAQIAIGNKGRVHVAWNGSGDDGPMNPDSHKRGMPLLYTRMNDAGTAFEPARNLMQHTFGLDGGGSIAADASGNVYVTWHGIANDEANAGRGEARRRVWLAKSRDEGRVFAPEQKAFDQPTGACGCCGMKIFAGGNGTLTALYRSATESVHRDIYLLTSGDQGRSFQGRLLHKWEINACPMSSMDIAEGGGLRVAAWETSGQIFWTKMDASGNPVGTIESAPGEGKGCKHPRLAVNAQGEFLLTWTEGTGWQKGGSFAWQLHDREGRRLEGSKDAGLVPVWSFAAPAAKPAGGFSILA